MRRIPLFLLVGVLLLAAPARADKGDKKAPDETKAREKIAKVWLDLVSYLTGRGYKAAATEALAEARETVPTAPEFKTLEDALAAMEDAGAPDTEGVKRREKAAKDAADGWEKLAKTYGDASDPHAALHLWRAIALDPTKGRIAKVADAAKKSPVLVRSPRHPMTAWLSLPGGWKAGKTYPVLVTVEGAGANFRGNHDGFRNGRGSREVIVLSPFALSSTNQLPAAKYPYYAAEILQAYESGNRVDWDNAGLLAVLDLLKDHLGADERVAITGFSGGGQLAYSFTFRHSDRVRLCAPACANFHPGLPGSGSEAKDGGPMVRIVTGEKDEHREHVFGQRPGIEGQTDQAVEAFEKLGYKQLKRTMLPGVGHSSCVREIWQSVDEVLGKKP